MRINLRGVVLNVKLKWDIHLGFDDLTEMFELLNVIALYIYFNF